MEAIINILQIVWFMIKWTFIMLFSPPFCFITIPITIIFIIKILISRKKK